MPDLSFRATLKPLEVEEVVDLLVHRPLGYAVARLCYPTFVSADLLTLVSMLLGIGSGVAFYASFFANRPHEVLVGVLLILSAVFDCSDGQLARMRQSSSRYGRMLDGAVDAVVQIAAIPAVVAHLWWSLGGPSPSSYFAPERAFVQPHGSLGGAALWLALSVVAIVSGLRHIALYDHFKNVYLHMTQPARKEGDDSEDVEADYARKRAEGPLGLVDWFRFFVYRGYVRSQESLSRWVDPFVPRRFAEMPAYSPATASRYRDAESGLMRAWSFYGIGTHIFLVGACAIFDEIRVYILARVLLWNLGLLWLIPAQRRASRAFFRDTDAPAA